MNANYRSIYAQSVRGPIILITIGVLFALHQEGVLSFGQTWPLIIIVVGVLKLIERAGVPPASAWQGQPGTYAPQNPAGYTYRPTNYQTTPYQTPPPAPPANPSSTNPPSGGDVR